MKRLFSRNRPPLRLARLLDPYRDQWGLLRAELSRWNRAGKSVPMWWRDDDAATLSDKLDWLLATTRVNHVPLGLAVVPSLMEPRLPHAILDAPHVLVLQHGFAHANRSLSGAPSEYPAGRPRREAIEEIATGATLLRADFGAAFLPVFVPPWNAMCDDIASQLSPQGFVGLSRDRMRINRVHDGLVEAAADLGFTTYRGGPRFIGTTRAIGRVLDRLHARRVSRRWGYRPIGMLTHHTELDDETIDFLDRLLAVFRDSEAVAWQSPKRVFALEAPADTTIVPMDGGSVAPPALAPAPIRTT